MPERVQHPGSHPTWRPHTVLHARGLRACTDSGGGCDVLRSVKAGSRVRVSGTGATDVGTVSAGMVSAGTGTASVCADTSSNVVRAGSVHMRRQSTQTACADDAACPKTVRWRTQEMEGGGCSRQRAPARSHAQETPGAGECVLEDV